MWRKIPDLDIIRRTAAALTANGLTAEVAANGADAKARALALIPSGASVMTVTSATTSQIGLQQELDESSSYLSVRNIIASQSANSAERGEARRTHLAVDWMVGSVHAVTQDGQVLIGSKTGSQLPYSAFSAKRVLWVIGAQKIVTDLAQGWQRLNECALARESERLQQVFGINSSLNKVLLIACEDAPERIHIILVQEELGF